MALEKQSVILMGDRCIKIPDPSGIFAYNSLNGFTLEKDVYNQYQYIRDNYIDLVRKELAVISQNRIMRYYHKEVAYHEYNVEIVTHHHKITMFPKYTAVYLKSWGTLK